MVIRVLSKERLAKELTKPNLHKMVIISLGNKTDRKVENPPTFKYPNYVKDVLLLPDLIRPTSNKRNPQFKSIIAFLKRKSSAGCHVIITGCCLDSTLYAIAGWLWYIFNKDEPNKYFSNSYQINWAVVGIALKYTTNLTNDEIAEFVRKYSKSDYMVYFADAKRYGMGYTILELEDMIINNTLHTVFNGPVLGWL